MCPACALTTGETPQTKWTAISIAIVCFFLLDFALNALQASLRNLLLDVTPAEQLGKANAWHGRMTHAGNILGEVHSHADWCSVSASSIDTPPAREGFTFGMLNLAGWKVLRPLGGDQFRKVCVVSVIILVITVWITVVTQQEKERQADVLNRESRCVEGQGSWTAAGRGNSCNNL